MKAQQAYVAGVLHGDGWCTALSFGLRTKDEDFATAFRDAVRDVTGKTLPLRSECQRGRQYLVVRTSNKSGAYSELKTYQPQCADEKSRWLRGMFDSDGNANFCKAVGGENSFHRRVAIYKSNIETLKKAAAFLESLEIPNLIRPMKNSSSHLGDQTVYELRVLRRDGFKKFAVAVGSSIQRKQKTLDLIADSYQPDGWQAENWKKAIAARWPRGGVR